MKKSNGASISMRALVALGLTALCHASLASLVIPSSVGVSNFTGGGSGVPYPVVYNLTTSSVQYNDRTYTFTGPLPNSWTNAEYIQTSNNDKSVTYTANFLSFTVQQAATIYIAFDTGISGSSIPGWLTSGYTNTGVTVATGGGTYALYRNNLDAGNNSVVTLGSNTANPCTACNMYSVIVVPATAALVQNLVVKNSTGKYPICGVGGTTCGKFDNFYAGTLLYSDRTYTLNAPPSSVNEYTFIQTANSDKNADVNNNTGYMTFNVSQESYVYVAFDRTHISPIPGWLSGSSAIFSDTGTSISSTGAGGPTLELYKSKSAYPAGAQVNLGSNEVNSTTSASMYSVIVVPVAGSTITAPTLSSTPICNNALVVGLNWTPASDNIGVQYYKILKNGAVVGTVSGDQTSFQDNSARTSGTNYDYSVAGYDSLGASATSNVVVFGTPAANVNGDSPYCPSTYITNFAPTPGAWGTSMTYPDSSGQRAVKNQPPWDDSSDIWPVTWGADNKSYVGFGDGFGLCGALDFPINAADSASFGFGVIDTSISQWVKESGTNKCYTSMENGNGYPEREHIRWLQFHQ